MINRRPKASDIADAQILAIIRDVKGPYASMRMDIEERLPEFPPKVVLAKLHALVRRKVLDGCDCGCRGDFLIIADRPAQ